MVLRLDGRGYMDIDYTKEQSLAPRGEEGWRALIVARGNLYALEKSRREDNRIEGLKL